MSGFNKNTAAFRLMSYGDPGGMVTGLWGKTARNTAASFDPLGVMGGVYGSKPRTVYDPIGMRLGAYGYKIERPRDPNSYNYDEASQTPARASWRNLLGAQAEEPSTSTSKTLLGQ